MKNHLLLISLFLFPGWIFGQDYYHELFPTDTIFFEYNTIPYQIVPSGDNCWQIGQPSKTYFDSAYSDPLAIVTDTLNPYPVNSNSSFYLVMPFDLVQNSFTTYIQFYHKFDTDTIQDYGSVEVSYDGGSSWLALVDSNCQNFWDCIHLYWDNDYILSTGQQVPHMLNPSGHSQGWVMSRYLWWWSIPVDGNPASYPPDSILVRFTFHSDATPSAKEGWMIDNILIGFRDEGTGINRPGNAEALKIIPNPLTTKSMVEWKTYGRSFDFTLYDVVGRAVFSEGSKQGMPVILQKEKFKPGIYFWKATADGMNSQSGKLVVN
jgi:hypothetical protein